MAITSGSLNIFDSFIPQKSRDILQAQNWGLFQSDIDRRLRMYNDDWRDLLINFIRSQIGVESRAHFFPPNATPLWPIPLHLNILKRVIDEISLVYSTNAKRRFIRRIEQNINNQDNPVDLNNPQDNIDNPQDQESERFGEIVNGEYNSKLQQINRLSNLCNIVLVRPVPDTNLRTGIRLDVLTPDQFIPIQDPDNPSRLIGVTYVIDLTDSPGGFAITRKEIMIYMGNQDEEPFYAESDNFDNKKIEKQPYPFYYKGEKYFPFVPFRSTEILTGEFINRTKGDDLYNGTLNASLLLSHWMRAFRENSGKQLVISGPGTKDAPKQFLRDNLAVLSFPGAKEDVTISQIDHSLNLESLWNSLYKFIESIIVNYGLSLDSFNARAQSGLSIKLANEKLITRVENQWNIYREAEKELAEIIRKENNRVLPSGDYGVIDDDMDFEIDFGTLPFEESPIEQVDNYQKLIDMNVLSRAEVLLKFNPDIGTIDDAQEQIKTNAKMNKEAARSNINLISSTNTPQPVQPQGNTPPPNPLEGSPSNIADNVGGSATNGSNSATGL